MRHFFIACLVALLVVFGTGAIDRYTIADIADQVLPAVVSITVGGGRGIESGGSGFFIDEGLVITNHHVVQGATEIRVTLASGEEVFDVELIGSDAYSDLALLRIATDQTLPALAFGQSGLLRLGEWLLAFGSPYSRHLGSAPSITLGILSAKDRVLEVDEQRFRPFLQTDAAINPGNSGGPLVDLDGKVVGISTAIIPYAQGIGFAIPADEAKVIVRQLTESGHVVRVNTGLQLGPSDSGQGAYVLAVGSGPAAKAGLRVGDVLVEVQRTVVQGYRQGALLLDMLTPGETVMLVVLRHGIRRYIVMEL